MTEKENDMSCLEQKKTTLNLANGETAVVHGHEIIGPAMIVTEWTLRWVALDGDPPKDPE